MFDTLNKLSFSLLVLVYRIIRVYGNMVYMNKNVFVVSDCVMTKPKICIPIWKCDRRYYHNTTRQSYHEFITNYSIHKTFHIIKRYTHKKNYQSQHIQFCLKLTTTMCSQRSKYFVFDLCLHVLCMNAGCR